MMYEIICNGCGQHQRWEADVITVSRAPSHCGACGGVDVTSVKFDSYWYDLAKYYGFEHSERGADLIRGLYQQWEPAKHYKFHDFVLETMKEAEIGS